jgi:transcriptional regulator with GAF, ATPase, and Fis domain
VSAREDQIVAAFVSMAGSLAQGHDVHELLTELAGNCARLLDVSAVGLLLADPRGALHVVAASSERIADLEAFQAQRGEGPCHTCYLDGQPVNVPDLEAAAARWPNFAPVAARAGVASVHAVPMRLREDIVGALNLFGSTTGALNEADLRLAQALADVATVALVQDRAAADRDLVTEQLQHALDSRVVLEQAKGVLSYSGELDMAAAYAALRSYARDHNIRITELARALVSRAVPAALVLEHAHARSASPASTAARHGP